jgi:hypothetical protein
MSIRVSKLELDKIVREELVAALSEQQCLYEGCEGNPYHDLDGRFVDPDKESGSYSRRDSSCKKSGQRKRTRASKYSTSINTSRRPCGRNSKYKCKSPNEEKWEEQLITDDEESVSGPDKAYIAGLIQQEFQRYTKHKPDGCTVDYCAKLVNGIIAATKGEMFKQAKS